MTRIQRESLVWGVLLLLVGGASLAQVYFDVSSWLWVGVFAIGGLLAFIMYWGDREDWRLLLTTYGTWVFAAILALILLNVLTGAWIPLFILTAIALPFLAVYYRDRAQWWALIPGYVLIVIALIVVFSDLGWISEAWVATIILFAIAAPFLYIFLRDRRMWWALIPAYVMLAVGLMVGLIDAVVLSDTNVAVYRMLAIALPFFVVFFNNTQNWWALIPAGVMTLIALGILFTTDLFVFIAPFFLMLAGIWILVRLFRESAQVDLPQVEGEPEDPREEVLPE